MSWYTSFFHWWRNHRQSNRLALIAETANLVIQQHGQAWTLCDHCPRCMLPISAVAVYCQFCGANLIPSQEPEKPVATEQPPIAYYEEPTRTTSAYNLTAIQQFVPPKRPILHDNKHFIPLIRTQQIKVPKRGNRNG